MTTMNGIIRGVSYKLCNVNDSSSVPRSKTGSPGDYSDRDKAYQLNNGDS